MKKILILAFVAMFASIMITGCEKEHRIITEDKIETYGNLDEILNMSDEEYNEYVKELIERTGVDIYELSKIKEVKDVINTAIKSYTYYICNDLPKLTLSDAVIDRMQELADSIRYQYSVGNEYEVLILYQEFCQLCNSIPGFSVNTGDYGIQTIIFDDRVVDFPTEYLQTEVDQAQAMIDGIINVYPSYNTLSPSTQIEVLTASIYVKIKENITDVKQASDYESCMQAAREDLAISLSTATALYEAALIGCAASAVAAPACVASASAAYGVSCGVSWWLYKRAIKRC